MSSTSFVIISYLETQIGHEIHQFISSKKKASFLPLRRQEALSQKPVDHAQSCKQPESIRAASKSFE